MVVEEGAKCKAPNQVHKSLDYDNLASEVMTAVVREDMASAKTSLERMNLLGHPGSPLSITGSLVGATCHAFLSLCQRRHRQTRGGKGLGEALHILSLQNLAASFDMACTRLLFSLLPTSHPAQWSITFKALDLAFANLPAVAYPSQSLKRTALRQFAEAGRPEEVRWLLTRMQEPFLAVSSKTSKGARSRQREKKREIGKESHPPSLGEVGKLHSSAWHLFKAYLYAFRPTEALHLLRTETSPGMLDVETTNMLLKALSRHYLVEELFVFFAWAEKHAMVRLNTESYTHAIASLARTSRDPKGSKEKPLTVSLDGETGPGAGRGVAGGTDCSNQDQALSLLARMESQGLTPDVHTFAALVDVFAEAGDLEGGLEVFFGKMAKERRLRPDGAVFGKLMKLLSRRKEWEKVIACHEAMEELGLSDTKEVSTVMVMYAWEKMGKWGEVKDLLGRIHQREGGVRTLKTFTYAMHAFGVAGKYQQALACVREVERREDLHTGMNAYGHMMLVHVCARGQDWAGVQRWWQRMQVKGLEGEADQYLSCAVLSACAVKGAWDDGLAFVDRVGACASSSLAEEAMALLVLRAAKAGRGQEVGEGVRKRLLDHGLPIGPFLTEVLAVVSGEEGGHAQEWEGVVRRWYERMEGQREREMAGPDVAIEVLGDLAGVRTPWPVSWYLVGDMAAQGLLKEREAARAVEALKEKEAFALFISDSSTAAVRDGGGEGGKEGQESMGAEKDGLERKERWENGVEEVGGEVLAAKERHEGSRVMETTERSRAVKRRHRERRIPAYLDLPYSEPQHAYREGAWASAAPSRVTQSSPMFPETWR